jgi:hypothetical protein
MRVFIPLLIFAAWASSALGAGVVVPAEQRYAPFSVDLPPCDDAGVIGNVQSNFASAQSTFWNSSLQLGSADRIREIGFRANGLAYIPRRYCVARMQSSDGVKRAVVYQIQADLGPIGWGYGVEWCVIGLDHNLAYAPACSVLRPFVERHLAEIGIVERD